MKRAAMFLVFLALLMVNSACYNAEAKAGLGLSHYGPFAVVYVNHISPPIPVGRVYNVGTEELAVTCTWMQKAGNKTLPAMVLSQHANFNLQSDESREVTVSVALLSMDYLGEYYGEVEVAAATLNMSHDGSPIVPGGTLTVNISVTETVIPASLELSNFTLSKKTPIQGETIHCSAYALNVGTVPGNFTVTWKMDDVLYGDKIVSLEGGETKLVSFGFMVLSAGTHQVILYCGEISLAESIDVLGEPFPWVWILIGVSLLIMFLLIMGVILSRKKRKEKEVMLKR